MKEVKGSEFSCVQERADIVTIITGYSNLCFMVCVPGPHPTEYTGLSIAVFVN